MSDTPATTPTAPEPTGENNSIREMRARIDAQNAELKAEKEARVAAEAKIQEADRAKLDEIDRVKAEKADLEKQVAALAPLKDQLQTFESRAEAEYRRELEAAPEDKRATLERLSDGGSYLDRVEKLRAAKALIPDQTTSTGGRPAPTTPGVVPPVSTFNKSNPWHGAFSQPS